MKLVYRDIYLNILISREKNTVYPILVALISVWNTAHNMGNPRNIEMTSENTPVSA